MVEITEEVVDKPGDVDEGDKDAAATTNTNNEWTKLMGENIQMNVLDDGQGGEDCQPQDAALIDFVGRLAPQRDDVFDGPIFHSVEDCLIVVGDKYVNPALEMGVRFMREGQKILLWSHSKFAYGLSTRKWNDYELPPNSNVCYEIKLKQIFSPKEESKDPDGFQLKLAMSKKLIANDMFKNELYNNNNALSEQGHRALRLYNKAADEMMHLLQSHASQKEKEGSDYKDDNHKKEQIQQATEIMLDSLNNVVAVYLKAKKYHEAKEAAVKVLTHDPTNFKALLRAARAAMMDPAGTYEEADAAIVAAEKVVTEQKLDDKDVRKLRQELKQKKQEYKKRKKEMMERMTKELKPKETQPTVSKVVVEEEEEAKQQEEAAGEIKSEQQTVEETKEEVPLWRRLLPYAIQIIFPFVLSYLVLITSKTHQQHIPRDLKGDDEFTSDVTRDEEF